MLRMLAPVAAVMLVASPALAATTTKTKTVVTKTKAPHRVARVKTTTTTKATKKSS